MSDWPYCTCEEPMVNDAETACLLCEKPFEKKAPPPLGVSVSETVVTTEKVA